MEQVGRCICTITGRPEGAEELHNSAHLGELHVVQGLVGARQEAVLPALQAHQQVLDLEGACLPFQNAAWSAWSMT